MAGRRSAATSNPRQAVVSILDGFPATVDWPGSFFYRDLIELYPDAKVLLPAVHATPDAWARSMRDTIWGLFYDDVLMRHLSFAARAAIDTPWRDYLAMMQEMWARSGLLDGTDTTLEFMSAAMSRYNDEVRQTVPADRLLVWTASDGWDPLCAFLDLPVPSTPFPRVNDRSEFAGRIVDSSLAAIESSRASTG